MTTPSIRLSDYQYHLPDEKIAKFPLTQRDASKLLHFEKGVISHQSCKELPDLLPKNSLTVVNDSEVVPARIVFQRTTGAQIEILLVKPIGPSSVVKEVMNTAADVTWEPMIGNLE